MKAQATAKLRSLRMSPRKVRLLIDLVRGMGANEAIVQLQFSKKAAARPVKKLIESAVANATHNSNLDPNSLVVKTAMVDGGPILYRWMPRAFGRATKLRKRTSHITIVLEGDVKAEAKKDKKAQEAKEDKKTETPKAEEPKEKKPAAKKETKPKEKKAEAKK